MATEKQLLKLEKIQTITKDLTNKETPKVLSRGRVGYEKAVRSLMLAGEAAAITSIFSIGGIILYIVIHAMGYHNPINNYEIYLSAFATICCIISGILGYKLWNLEATPLFALISLLIIITCNLLLVFGILPAVTVVFSIIALCRYGTFCSWFNGIK